MTIQELYQDIDGSYDQAIKVLRMDKLIDKHIRKLPQNGTVDALIDAGNTKDPTALFETAHAVKGVCGNLGLVKLADAASEITEEFRPGSVRSMSDEELDAKIRNIEEIYDRTLKGIQAYEESN